MPDDGTTCIDGRPGNACDRADGDLAHTRQVVDDLAAAGKRPDLPGPTPILATRPKIESRLAATVTRNSPKDCGTGRGSEGLPPVSFVPPGKRTWRRHRAPIPP